MVASFFVIIIITIIIVTIFGIFIIIVCISVILFLSKILKKCALVGELNLFKFLFNKISGSLQGIYFTVVDLHLIGSLFSAIQM
jgi:hypothetical protein